MSDPTRCTCPWYQYRDGRTYVGKSEDCPMHGRREVRVDRLTHGQYRITWAVPEPNWDEPEHAPEDHDD